MESDVSRNFCPKMLIRDNKNVWFICRAADWAAWEDRLSNQCQVKPALSYQTPGHLPRLTVHPNEKFNF